MRAHRDGAAIRFPATLAQIPDQFVRRLELRARRFIAIEIAHQTDAERNVVQVIAVDVAAVDLASPAIADFDLAVARGGAVADNEMVGEAGLSNQEAR